MAAHDDDPRRSDRPGDGSGDRPAERTGDRPVDPQAARHDSASRFADSVAHGVYGSATTAAGGTPLQPPFPDRDPLAPRSGWAIAAPLLLVLAAGAGYLGWRAIS
ncbi:MAG: hypothetical protein PGN11_20365 [Quadrisphaera sp.]